MARRKTPGPPVRKSSEHITRFDEGNIARLGLISIQERIPEDFTSWAVEFNVDGNPARLACVAPAEYGGVPHGLDNDVSLALLNLYMEAGSPEGGEFTCTSFELLKSMGLDTSGHYYEAVQQSLDRLKAATYEASRAWNVAGRWVTVKFNYIERWEFTSDDGRRRQGEGSIVRVRLAQEITRSVRAQYIKPLDRTFLTSLDRPRTRGLYRLLDAQRLSPDGEIVSQFSTALLDWAQACKIVDRRPDKIRRTLDPSHEELRERGYLADVIYTGRGIKQVVTYVFHGATVIDTLDVPLVQTMTAHGVAATVAQALVAEFGGEHIKARLARFEAILDSGYKPRSKAGLLVDVIRDLQGKYVDPEGFVSQERRKTLDVQRRSRQEREEQQLNTDDERRRLEFEQMPIPQQASRVISVAGTLFGKRVPAPVLALLADDIKAQKVSAADMLSRITRAAMNLQLEDLAAELIQSYR